MASIAMKQLRSRASASGRALLLAALLVAGGAVEAAALATDLRIEVISNRPDLISGGDALVEVVLPADIVPANVRVQLNGADITAAFALRPNSRFMGLVEGLNLGDNELRAYVTSAPSPPRKPAEITITNHAIGGPVFSGKQLLPWICARRVATPVTVTVPGTNLTGTTNTRVSGLNDDPVNDQCDAPPTLAFFYQPTTKPATCTFAITGANACFVAYDLAHPPAETDIANFTNDRGDTVKSILLVEKGTINRGIYQIITFLDPTKPNAPWAPQKGWNGKLFWRFGASASVSRYQTATSAATAAINENALRRGFMLAASSLTDHGTNSNDTLGAETVMMLKEQITETYGEIRYTMSDGCSGGSIMQQSIASGYPGLLDGIQPNCSFPDTMTTGIEIADCGVLQANYYLTPNGSALTTAQMSAINGHLNTGFCTAWVLSFLPLLNPSRGANCGNLPASVVYDPVLRPNGVRCTSSDHAVGMLGTFIDTDGNTKANQPGDNVGLQYGLKALQAGTINAEEFVKLNQGVGGYTADAKWTGPATFAPRQAVTSTSVLDTVYSAGIVSDGRQLAKLPIIDLRGNQSAGGDIHMNWRPWAVRDRLDRDFGDHDNQLIFAYTGGGGAGAPGAALVLKSFTTLDTWLSNIEKDTSNQPIEAKVRANKPAGAADLCVTNNGATDADVAAAVALDAPTCPVKFQGSPRQAAGGPLAENIFKCQLKALNFADPDYAGITFTEDQQARLAAAFPSGVCDWSKPGVGQVASAGGTTYKAGPGGQPFGDEPGSGLGTSLLTALNAAKLWVGIKNSDDVGTFFDVRADVYRNGDPNPIGGGQLNRTAAASSGFNNAKLNTIPLTLAAGPQEVPSGTVLKVKVSARITCTGPTHATGSLRLWFNDAQAGSNFDATIDGVSEDYFLRSGSVLGATQGAGPKTTIDVALNSKEKCGGRTLVDVGSWTITLP